MNLILVISPKFGLGGILYGFTQCESGEVTRTHRIGACVCVGCVGRGARRIDGAVVDHGDEGHRHVDPHGVDVGEAKERQEGQDMTFAERRSFVCKADLNSV